MRLSNNWKDPAYATTQRILRRCAVDIYLDGVLQTTCMTADDQRGRITRASLNSRGKLQTTACGRRVKMEQISGRVVIKLSARK